MNNPFDFSNGIESKLRDDCFRVVSMVAMVAEDPGRNAHFLNDCTEIIEEMRDYLADAGVQGDGRNLPESQQLDAVDMLFLKTAEGLKQYFKRALTQDDELNDYDED